MKIGSLFSGIGCLDRAVEIVTSAATSWQIEQVAYRRAVLSKHFVGATQHEDVRTFKAREHAEIDLLCGGFPCRDISALGSKEGLDGKKSGLWSEYVRIIDEAAPVAVFIENVALLKRRGLDRVLRDLAVRGFDVAWKTTEGRHVGRYFKRPRIFLLACTEGAGRRGIPATWIRQSQFQQGYDAHGCDAGLPWPADGQRDQNYHGPQPGIYRSAIGNSRGLVARQRAARVYALGDTVSIPQAVVAYRWCAGKLVQHYASLG